MIIQSIAAAIVLIGELATPTRFVQFQPLDSQLSTSYESHTYGSALWPPHFINKPSPMILGAKRRLIVDATKKDGVDLERVASGSNFIKTVLRNQDASKSFVDACGEYDTFQSRIAPFALLWHSIPFGHRLSPNQHIPAHQRKRRQFAV